MRIIKQIRRELSVIRVLLEELVDQGQPTKIQPAEALLLSGRDRLFTLPPELHEDDIDCEATISQPVRPTGDEWEVSFRVPRSGMAGACLRGDVGRLRFTVGGDQ